MTQRMNYEAAAPGGMKALGSVYGYVAQSGLPATLIELVYLRVSQINGCAYCIDMHSRELLKAEVPVEKLVLVPAWDEAGSLFSGQEKAALKWAEVGYPGQRHACARGGLCRGPRHVQRKAAG